MFKFINTLWTLWGRCWILYQQLYNMLLLLVGGHSTAHPHPLLPAGWPQGSDDRAEEAQTENRSVRGFSNKIPLFVYHKKQCCGFGFGSVGSICFWASWILSSIKNSKENLDSYFFVTPFDFLSLKNDVNVPSKSNKQKNFFKIVFCWCLKGQWR